MKKTLLILTILTCNIVFSQEIFTPELLHSLGRVHSIKFDSESETVFYSVTTPSPTDGSKSTMHYTIPLKGGEPAAYAVRTQPGFDYISPDGNHRILTKSVTVNNVLSNDIYPNYSQSNAYIYTDLQYRHWDTWENGTFNHLFVASTANRDDSGIDIMKSEPYNCPTKPFGGDEDFTWSPDSKNIIYVKKEKQGKEFMLSTNTDIFSFNIETQKTENISKGMMGYDTNPKFSKSGILAWLSMKRDGYEADKNDIIVSIKNEKINLTESWNGSVNSFEWSEDSKKIFFTAPSQGTIQLFEIDVKKGSKPSQITNGQFDITGICGETKGKIVVTKTDMTRAAEVYSLDKKTKELFQITHVNDEIYNKVLKIKVEKRMVKTTDDKDMVTWVIYPPQFDKNKKYPVILYCQGGPQSPLTQFYSYRWNFQVMASQGYIVVAPNRRGMHGFGTEWNEQISKDWGGQCMDDYLSAIDDVSKETYVDKDRIACVGASFGGYSVFYLAGIHKNRFKSFIAHDGIFNLESMYGTTEEMWFVNWDLAGSYWDKNPQAIKSYQQFNPIHNVEKWNTPILIFQGGKDYRVPDGQAFEAFQAAQLKGIKSKLVYFPEENHWVLGVHNALVWQSEFFRWLNETLNN